MSNLDTIVWLEFDKERGTTADVTASMLCLPGDIQKALNLSGTQAHTSLGDFITIIDDPRVSTYEPVQYIAYLLKCWYPDVLAHVPQVSPLVQRKYAGRVRVLETCNSSKPISAGYHALACPEPLILEPEDWTKEEWATLCKLCGVDANKAVRVVMNVSSVEAYISSEKEIKEEV